MIIDILNAIIDVESSGNAYAIGIVGASLSRQPKNINEAIHVLQKLESKNYNYSIGLMQINKQHFKSFGWLRNFTSGFTVQNNIIAGYIILNDCIARSYPSDYNFNANKKLLSKDIIFKSLSCYYTGKFHAVEGYQYANKVYKRIGNVQWLSEKNLSMIVNGGCQSLHFYIHTEFRNKYLCPKTHLLHF